MEPRLDAENVVSLQPPQTVFARIPNRRRPFKPEKPSEKKAAANRQNAQRSTGPRTAAGKVRSSRNSTRHGLFSRDLVLTAGNSPENPAEYAACRDSLAATVDSDDPVQRALIDRAAACFWLFRRAHRYDAAACQGGFVGDRNRDAASSIPPQNQLFRLIRYESRVDRQLHRALRKLSDRQESVRWLRTLLKSNGT